MKKSFALIALFFASSLSLMSVTPSQLESGHLLSLAQQGIPQESILGVGDNGVPRVCGTGLQTTTSLVVGGTNSTSSLLPAGMRSWECIPNVIRNDGIESFRVEVDLNGPVNKVTFEVNTDHFVAASGTNFVTLRDDGLSGDKVAGDFIFTSEQIRYRAQVAMPPYQGSTSDSIPGIYMPYSGWLYVLETNNTTSQFLNPPITGILNTNIPAVQTVLLASNIQASTHFINVITTNREAQRSLRSQTSVISIAAKQVYSVLPDAFDFLSFFTTDHLEYLPRTTSPNFVAGRHYPIRVNFTGTGFVLYDIGSSYGSTNQLKGLNVYDTLQRGIGNSRYALHEYLHLWSAHTSTTLGLTSDGSHYRQNCTAFSVVGGFYPTYLTNGNVIQVRRDCVDDTNAPPIDKYMMGLISTSAVPTLYVMTNFPNINCDNIDYFTNAKPVTISDIVAVHGVRTPGPESAQRHFTIGFAAASHQRFLNATEMTLYEYLADFFTRSLLPESPAPALGKGYVPITKYFGEGVTWSSKGLGLIRPAITNAQSLVNGFQVDGTGYPGRTYQLLASTNLNSWTQVTNKTAGTNASFSLHDLSQPRPTRRWYKVSTP